jgi:pyrroloquinoline quinone biosynthesis protein B
MQERAGEAVCAGILLTHAHIGHYTGLIHLGYEAMCSRALPVYATASMSRFLRSHAPWRQLVEMNNITLIELEPDQPEWLTDRLCIEPVPVPHRAEWSDTVGFIVGGPNRRLLYVPDIDAWGRWERDVRKVVEGVDIALLDGTFFSADELSGRDATAIGHPLVTATVERLQGVNTDVRFIHLNHSNPLHREGESLDWLLSRGFAVGQMGDCWEL